MAHVKASSSVRRGNSPGKRRANIDLVAPPSVSDENQLLQLQEQVAPYLVLAHRLSREHRRAQQRVLTHRVMAMVSQLLAHQLTQTGDE